MDVILKMLLTKECDYGVRIIRVLADGEKRTVQTISEAEHIPLKYTYKIIKKLEKVGLVKSIRGIHGGYVLVKNLEEFSLLDIVASIDKKLVLNECLLPDAQCQRNNPDAPCNVHQELGRIQSVLVTELLSKNMTQVLFPK